MSQKNSAEKKTNKKVIALGIICIILAASLIVVFAVYLPKANNSDLQEQLAEKDNTIQELQDKLSLKLNATQYVLQIAYLEQSLVALNDTLTSKNAELSSTYDSMFQLQQIVQLTASELMYQNSFIQDPNATTTVDNYQIGYAGYVVVQATATANTTYAEALYSFQGANIDYKQTLGTSGTAILPVLPGTVEIRIGNVNQTSTNSVNAIITYYY